jgi:hypothetical protein
MHLQTTFFPRTTLRAPPCVLLRNPSNVYITGRIVTLKTEQWDRALSNGITWTLLLNSLRAQGCAFRAVLPQVDHYLHGQALCSFKTGADRVSWSSLLLTLPIAPRQLHAHF